MKNLFLNMLRLVALSLIFCFSTLRSQDYWIAKTVQTKKIEDTPVNIFSFDESIFKNELKNQNFNQIFLPNENNENELFIVEQIFILSTELSLKFPLIKTYKGYSKNRPNVSSRITYTPRGISAWINIPGKENIFIQPDRKSKGQHYVYKRSEEIKKEWECKTEFEKKSKSTLNNFNRRKLITNDKVLRKFRLAIATTAEYTNYWNDNVDENGSAQEDALAAIVSTMNRVNSVYETDLSITMELVSGTEIIYTDPDTDPYSGNYNSEVQADLTSNIGEENYDIGHLFAYGSNNGNAGCIGCICVNGSKGSAFTSHGFLSDDGEFLTDYFDIDYVSHEMGHQFGAYHSFAFNNEGSGSNVEPGSGSTIMGYAGITGPDDVQPHSDPYFNYKSIEDISDYISTTSCYTSSDLINSPPIADAGNDYVIPIGTAYELRANGYDLDNDQLTYCWEQIDSESMTYLQFGPENYLGTTARSLPPSLNPVRSIPNLISVLNGELTQVRPEINSAWETVPNIPRELNWGLTVRDRSPSSTGQGGQSSTDSVTLTTTSKAGPFKIISQADDEIIWKTGDNINIEWDVAGTNLDPINTSNVTILLSLNAGEDFNITLSDSTPNDGIFLFQVPGGISSENARIKIVPNNSIYFAINQKPIKIEQRPFAVFFNEFSYDFCSPNNESISFDLGVYEQLDNPISISVNNLVNGVSYELDQSTFSSSTSSITLDLFGLSNLPIGKSTINIVAESENVSAVFPIEIRSYDQLISGPNLINPIQESTQVIEFDFEWETDPNFSKYKYQISKSSNFIDLVLEIETEDSLISIRELDPETIYFWRVASSNECGISEWSETFSFESATITNNSYLANNLPIDLNDPTSLGNIGYTSSSIFISDVNPISEIEILVSINHTYVSDLSLFLISPDGSKFSLAENLGLNTSAEEGDNFTNTVFTQNSNISINNAFPPFTGSFRPNQPIDGLIGTSAFGNWKLNIEDNYPEDSGELINFQLNITVKGELLKNSDFDSFADSIDNCPEITNQDQIDTDEDGEGDICDFDAQDNFEIMKFDESCVTKNNGSITISAFAEFDYTYNLIGPNGFSLDGSFSRQSGETINNLQSGDYMLCIYSNNDQQIERCFTAVISEPEPLSVNTIINYNNQELNLNLNGAENYFIELNGKSYNYGKLDNISLPLKKGINQLKVSTETSCQGLYQRTINVSDKMYVSPNPVNSIAKIHTGNNDKNLKVEIFTIDGEFIESNEIKIYDELNYFEWSMDNYTPGIYIMNITTKINTQSVKIIKR